MPSTASLRNPAGIFRALQARRHVATRLEASSTLPSPSLTPGAPASRPARLARRASATARAGGRRQLGAPASRRHLRSFKGTGRASHSVSKAAKPGIVEHGGFATKVHCAGELALSTTSASANAGGPETESEPLAPGAPASRPACLARRAPASSRTRGGRLLHRASCSCGAREDTSSRCVSALIGDIIHRQIRGLPPIDLRQYRDAQLQRGGHFSARWLIARCRERCTL